MDPISEYFEITTTTNTFVTHQVALILPVAIIFPKSFDLDCCDKFTINCFGKEYKYCFKLIMFTSTIYSSNHNTYLQLNGKIMFDKIGYLDYGGEYKFMISTKNRSNIPIIMTFSTCDLNNWCEEYETCQPIKYDNIELHNNIGITSINKIIRSIYIISDKHISHTILKKITNISCSNDIIFMKKNLLWYYKWTIFHKYALYAGLENFLPNEIIDIIEKYVCIDESYFYKITIKGSEHIYDIDFGAKVNGNLCIEYED